MFTIGVKAISMLLDEIIALRFEPRLLSEILLHGERSFYEIDTVDKAGRWGIKVFGFNERDIFDRKEYTSYQQHVPVKYLNDDKFRNLCKNLFYWNNKISDISELECGECVPDIKPQETIRKLD